MIRTTQRMSNALVIGNIVAEANGAQNGADAIDKTENGRVHYANHIYTLTVQ